MEAFDSFRQNPQNGAYFLVRTTGNAAASTPTIRGIVRDLDPSLALYSAQTMDDLRSRSMAKAKFLTVLLVMFAAIGVALSVVGVYGVLAHVSRNRTREMGIRIALGARASQVRWLVIRQGVTLAAAGLAIGVAVALIATRAMSKLLFDVSPDDPLTLVGVVVALAATSVVASWLPALVASRADPSVALRAD
ncbi:MAG: FtsX-like permease family protein [Gemmatimonadaceae bacterium]